MSGKIVSGYDPLLKVTIFQRHLTHTCTQIEAGEKGGVGGRREEEKKPGGCLALYIVLARFMSCGHQQ